MQLITYAPYFCYTGAMLIFMFNMQFIQCERFQFKQEFSHLFIKYICLDSFQWNFIQNMQFQLEMRITTYYLNTKFSFKMSKAPQRHSRFNDKISFVVEKKMIENFNDSSKYYNEECHSIGLGILSSGPWLLLYFY